MNAYLWFQFGSFAYGFSGRVEGTLQQMVSVKQALIELDPPENDSLNLPVFLESILDTRKHLLRVDVCFHDAGGRYVTRHLPELFVSNNVVKLKLVALEAKLEKKQKGQNLL